ncbi:minor tail protein [Mycobacterium phage Groundhog]|nr:minor tail protein [Mycobacterium phage Groundhog]
MTSPNQPAPPGAFVWGGGDLGFGQDYNETLIKSLFKLPEINIGNALDLMRDQLMKLPLEALEVFKPIIPDWIEDDFANVANAVSKIMSILIDPIKFLLEADWEAWIQNTWNGFQTVVNQIIEILRGFIVTPINQAVQDIKYWWAGLLNFRGSTEANQTNLQNFQISAMTQGYKNPPWVCRYPIADVTYPEALNFGLSVYGTTGPQSAGTAHTHELETGDVSAEAVSWNIPQNRARVAKITASSTTVWDTIGVILNKTTTAAINNVYLEIMREDALGGATLLASVDVSPQLTDTGYDYIEATLPGIITKEGENYWIRIRNSSTVATPLYVRAVEWVAGNANSCGYADATLATKTSYTAAELNGIITNEDSWPLPWALVATKNRAPTDQSFSDDFNRSGLGSLWFVKSDSGSNQLGISGNKASFSGLTDGVQNGLYILPTAGDKQWVEGVSYGSTLALSGPRGGLLLNCNRDLSQVVYLGWNLNSAKIYTGPWNSLTERASVNTALNDVPWQFYYDPATGQYIALKNGQDIGLGWADTTSAMKHGPDFRYGGLRISRAAFFNACQIDNWTLKDWS